MRRRRDLQNDIATRKSPYSDKHACVARLRSKGGRRSEEEESASASSSVARPMRAFLSARA